MPTAIAFNTDLALPASPSPTAVFAGDTLPPDLVVGGIYRFRKAGHRTYRVDSLVTLLEMRRESVLFSLRAQVRMIEVSYIVDRGRSYTVGQYQVEELLSD